MISQSMTIPEAMERARTMPYAWVLQDSRAYLGKTGGFSLPDAPGNDWREARFFGPEGELRLTRSDKGSMEAFWLTETGDEVLDQARPLLPEFGRQLTVRRILDYDEDGQVCVAATRMLRWEGGDRT